MSSFSDDASPADAQTDATPHAFPGGTRLRFELIFASAWLAFGLFVLPAVIFAVGILLLGPYGEGAGQGVGLGRFYLDFFADLAQPSGRTWMLAIGPLLLVSIVRAVFLGTPEPTGNDDDAPQHENPGKARPRASTGAERVEPRIGLD